MDRAEISRLSNIDLIAQLISHAHTFGDYIQETRDFTEELLYRLNSSSRDSSEVITVSDIQWYKFSDIFKTIADIQENNWSWAFNNRCKYIDIRIDMRDLKCLLKDRYGDVITIKELVRQHEKVK